jgi:hypothetical protein
MNIGLKIGEATLTIPYDPAQRKESYNYGYVDLKANPHLIDTIPEVQGWHELSDLLKSINSSSSRFQSLGCEKSYSDFADVNYPSLTTKLVSYVDVAFADINLNSIKSNFEYLINEICIFSGNYNLSEFFFVDYELTPTFYENWSLQGWCLSIWVGGHGNSENEARDNWASPIAVLRDFFRRDSIPNLAASDHV